MARLELSAPALDELELLVRTHSLPDDTIDRVRRRLDSLRRFPELGSPLIGRWQGFRFILGPWRWMVLVYAYLEDEDRVVVTTIQDGRSKRSPTSSS